MSIQVFGTGQGRTGTTSLKQALEHLGYGKCYHMFELLNNPEQVIYFEKAERGEEVDWDNLFKGYHSACDFPVIRYYQDILKRYPDARVIHTIRDQESWFKSASNTIFWVTQPSPMRIFKMMIRLPFSPTLRKRLRVLKFNGMMIRKVFGEDLKNKEKIIDVFNKYNDEILRNIPKEKMLIYDVKDGWEPLCRFLGVPVPKIPFPKSNTTDEFVFNVKNKILKKKLEE
ncbi:MAG: sulfotransferase family protein [Saprospiraceae bacterium]